MQATKFDEAEKGLSWLTLLTTSGTLVCCALPIILVTLGMGSLVASMVNALPFLVTLSQHKIWVFTLSGVLLALSLWLMYRPNRSCPTDPELAAICRQSMSWNKVVVWLSVSLWGIGFFAAFLALPLQIWWESWL